MGAARDCLESTLEYAGTRIQFDKPIAAFQLTQAKLADTALEYYKGLLLALHLGRLKDSGDLRPEQVSLGKLNNVREAIEIAPDRHLGVPLSHSPPPREFIPLGDPGAFGISGPLRWRRSP